MARTGDYTKKFSVLDKEEELDGLLHKNPGLAQELKAAGLKLEPRTLPQETYVITGTTPDLGDLLHAHPLLGRKMQELSLTLTPDNEIMFVAGTFPLDDCPGRYGILGKAPQSPLVARKSPKG